MGSNLDLFLFGGHRELLQVHFGEFLFSVLRNIELVFCVICYTIWSGFLATVICQFY